MVTKILLRLYIMQWQSIMGFGLKSDILIPYEPITTGKESSESDMADAWHVH